MDSFWEPFALSLKLAFLTTLILFVMGVFMVYWMSYFDFKLKSAIKAIITLPLVMPPSVLGYYLLIAFQPDQPVGFIGDYVFNTRLAFSFTGILIGSVIFSMPFMINPILSAAENLPKSYKEAAFTLGKSKWITFRKVTLPNIRPSIITALLMTFAHTIGEFGVILMIGGNIPGQTRVASIAIYHELEALNYPLANRYSFILLIFSFLVLLSINFVQKRTNLTGI